MGGMEWLPCRIDGEAAAAFVRQHGSLREQAQLAGILDGARPERSLVRELEQLQNGDGGFPPGEEAGGPSSLAGTCRMLSRLRDLPPLAGSPMAARAIAYIRRNQQVDGSWVEPPAAAAVGTLWMRPTNREATHYLTAVAAHTLATLAPEQVEPVRRGVAWLRQAIGDQVDNYYALTVGLFWATRYRLEPGSAGELRGLFDRAVADCDEATDASELARILSGALDVRAGGEYLLPILQALVRLAEMQGQDGAWQEEGGQPDVDATLSALRVFRGFGLI